MSSSSSTACALAKRGTVRKVKHFEGGDTDKMETPLNLQKSSRFLCSSQSVMKMHRGGTRKNAVEAKSPVSPDALRIVHGATAERLE